MAKRKGEQTNRRKRQWFVPSKASGKNHKVSEDKEGKFFCDCWPFRKNRICDHIRDARAGDGRLIGEPEIPEPTLGYGWVVTQVTPMYAPQLPHSTSSSLGGGVRLVSTRRLYQRNRVRDFIL